MKLSLSWKWILVPSFVCAAVIGAMAIPNFSAARTMRADSRNLSKATDQYLVQRDDFDRLRADVDHLRTQRDESGHALRSDLNESKLIPSLTRQIDGQEVLDQSIRIGDREALTVRPAGIAIDRRTIDVQLTGSFEALFSTVKTAESEAGMTRVRSIDIRRSGAQVQAIVGIDEYFLSAEGQR
ncbi:MAG: hypothetical protein EXS01_00990 [Phycisphaerales bacterium]|nr:hypothetical protein [Phycisphaerales bacterium]